MKNMPQRRSKSYYIGLRSELKSRPLLRKEKTKSFFATVMKSGVLSHSKHLSLRSFKAEPLKSYIKVVVSKRSIPSSVSRNRIRRQIRSICMELNPQSLQAIFYAQKSSQDLSFRELKREVTYLINKV